jgi:cell division protein FtsQ
MDDRGRLAQSLIGMPSWRAGIFARRDRSAARPAKFHSRRLSYAKSLERCAARLAARLPRRAGIMGCCILMLVTLVYGIAKGGHLAAFAAGAKNARDWVANVAGWRVVAIALTGNQHVTREEVLAIAGVTGTTSLLFLDVDEARERLKRNPWIADATVLKLYPGEVQISIKERTAFALWQKEGAVSVIADDGTVLEPYVAPRLLRLPLLVGVGAELRAREFIDLLNRHSSLRDQVRASILVGARRWSLRLRNGIEVRLPESGVAAALDRLASLESEKKLLTRDVVVIDLRLPDRVTVRLSDAASAARLEALKEKQKKKASLTPQGLGEHSGRTVA